MLFYACNFNPVDRVAPFKYGILSELEPKIEYGKNCTDGNKLKILDVYSEAKTRYKEVKSDRTHRIAQNVVKFVPEVQNLQYSVWVDWINQNGKGRLDNHGILTSKENNSGEIFWRFSLPGSYLVFWRLTNQGCTVYIDAGLFIGLRNL